MQSMPMMSSAMSAFDPSLVRYISVNLQESSDQIRSVIERQQWQTTLAADAVALDIDGVAAQRYETSVIPQTVVIGPDGKVQGLYIGGGSGVVEQVSADVRTLLEAGEASQP
jgi:hypothetical protein